MSNRDAKIFSLFFITRLNFNIQPEAENLISLVLVVLSDFKFKSVNFKISLLHFSLGLMLFIHVYLHTAFWERGHQIKNIDLPCADFN